MAARPSRTPLLVGAVLLVVVGAAVAIIGPAAPGAGQGPDGAAVQQFGNETSFQEYVARGHRMDGVRATAVEPTGAPVQRGGDGATRQEVADDAPPRPTAQETRTPQPARTEAPADGAPGRVGTTNVQVAGFDEPDLVKTDGTHFYYAPERFAVHRPAPIERDGVDRTPPERRSHTHVLDVREPADPRAVAEVEADGRLLRTGDRLVVLGSDRLTGYDVSDPSNPVESWTRPVDDPIVTAREHDGTVYLVTRTAVGPDPRCPIEPLGADAAVPCGEVHRPDVQVAVDATYSAFAIDADDGAVHDAESFVGTARGTAVYMSEGALYVTYTERTSRAELMADFLVEEFDRTPERLERRVAEIRSYDISPASERREIQRAVDRWLDSLDDEERRAVRRALREDVRAYLADRQRDLARTGIVRVAVDGPDLAVEATGSVPGRPLNQFSLDAHDGQLRIATTIPGQGRAESENDLYVLDAADLSELGRETGMGAGQEVYAVRYVDDTAYVVTFRQVDPLHVVDLSDPANPTERGTLELPGFSSYLHPIDDGHVLGIGEEDGRVKAVLFDVSDPTDPRIADSKRLAARWSAVRGSHHAFTIDRRHGVFFLPAGGSGLVVDYRNETLSRVHTVETDEPALRARYVDDYLYVFAGSEVAVVDESTWERVATRDLGA